MSYLRVIRKSLTRPNLVFGCERTPILFSLGCCSALILFGQSKLITGLAILIFLFTLWGLRKMSNNDPHMFAVYRRHIKQKPYYSGRSRPYR